MYKAKQTLDEVNWEKLNNNNNNNNNSGNDNNNNQDHEDVTTESEKEANLLYGINQTCKHKYFSTRGI